MVIASSRLGLGFRVLQKGTYEGWEGFWAQGCGGWDQDKGSRVFEP